ncbi:MAG: P-loop NTPase [Dehalococcoidia bacterium]|nr:P-loop NTPase [Dehalococcoidia bacterium]
MTDSYAEREILAINVDMSCTLRCENCERFFDCRSPSKMDIYQRRRMNQAKGSMSSIKHKVAVVGGKGGVGKSIITSNMGVALAMRGRKVSILDQDFDGATIPRMLGVHGRRLKIGDNGIIPVEGFMGIDVVSMGSILTNEEVLTWFHEMRRSATEEFVCHVNYGERDYLLVDMPPGTSSDAVNLMEYIPDLVGAVVVTIPSEVSQNVARKATLLCKKASVRIFGIIENMSGYVCPKCGERVDIMSAGGGQKLAEEMDVPFLGRIPMDPRLSQCSDEGIPFVYKYPESPAAIDLNRIVDTIEGELGY